MSFPSRLFNTFFFLIRVLSETLNFLDCVSLNPSGMLNPIVPQFPPMGNGLFMSVGLWFMGAIGVACLVSDPLRRVSRLLKVNGSTLLALPFTMFIFIPWLVFLARSTGSSAAFPLLLVLSMVLSNFQSLASMRSMARSYVLAEMSSHLSAERHGTRSSHRLLGSRKIPDGPLQGKGLRGVWSALQRQSMIAIGDYYLLRSQRKPSRTRKT